MTTFVTAALALLLLALGFLVWRGLRLGEEAAGRTTSWPPRFYRPISMSQADAELLEMRKRSVAEITRLFAVPPQVIERRPQARTRRER